MTTHPIVSREAWLEARRALLLREKEETRLRDAVRAERRALPWVRIDKDYAFDTRAGRRTLAELFDGRSQLLVYHFMFAPEWDAGCVGCSFLADHLGGALPHLNNHDVTLIAASRAPLATIEAYRRRMDWDVPWVSSAGSDFNYDFGVSFTPEQLASGTVDYNFADLPSDKGLSDLPGMSAFVRDADGTVFHTYSAYARGIEEWIGTLMILDRAPLGRNEDATMHFVRRHDEYADAALSKDCCHAAKG